MAPTAAGLGPGDDLPDPDRLRIAEELSQHRAGVLNPAYGLFDPDPPPQLYAASTEQQQRFLEPLLRREVSCFRGLEDPDLSHLPVDAVRIRAQRHPEGWMLDGTKLFVADATDAAFGIVYANSEPVPGERHGVSAIVVETDRVGFQHWRPWPTLAAGRDTMEINLSAVKVPESNLLGEVGNGPSFANDLVLRRRLFSAAHLTGVASAAQDMSRSAVWSRREHGTPLAAGERARLALADNEIGISAARALYIVAAEHVSDMALTATAFATQVAESVVERAMDLHGPFWRVGGLAARALGQGIAMAAPEFRRRGSAAARSGSAADQHVQEVMSGKGSSASEAMTSSPRGVIGGLCSGPRTSR